MARMLTDVMEREAYEDALDPVPDDDVPETEIDDGDALDPLDENDPFEDEPAALLDDDFADADGEPLPDEVQAEIEAHGALSRLAAWRAPRAIAWASGVTSQYLVLRDLARRAGFPLSGVSASATLTTLAAPFLVQPGARLRPAIDRILDRGKDILTARGALLTLREAPASESSMYAYGTTHALRVAEATAAARDVGWSRAIGIGAFAEAVDEAALFAGAPVEVLSDRALTTTALATTRATTSLRRAGVDRPLARIAAAPHAGQEPGDVIEVTDTSMGWEAERFRVLEIRLDYARAPRPRYEMTLVLGEP